MPSPSKPHTTADVPAQVFQNFLDKLVADGADAEMVGRLKTTLLEKHDYSEDGLEAAVFGESEGDD
jgi:hypothetical protein